MRIHFIAIAGSAMHNLAIALHKKGYQITGSDDAIFEPSLSRLNVHGLVPKAFGWFPENIDPTIDAIVLGMHAKIDNPELLKAQELNIPIYSYPAYIYEQSKNKTRVVIGGSHGKTSITSMIMHVLKYYQIEVDYLVGAQLEGFDTMVQLTEAPVIIIEGDEYLASPIEPIPKFHLYKAHIAVISGIAWDHINVFPTFEDYILQFKKFINTIQKNGTLFYCEKENALNNLIKTNTFANDLTIIPYQLPDFNIINNETFILKPIKLPLKIFGEHNLMNLEAARNVCNCLGVEDVAFFKAIADFKGAAKRLEVVLNQKDFTIFKDFAHAPSKLKASIKAVKSQFKDRKLISCLELHTFSSLNKTFLAEYAHSADESDDFIVYVNKETLKSKAQELFTRTEIEFAFQRKDLLFFDDIEKLKTHLKKQNFFQSNLLMMSSGNFGNMNFTELTNNE